MARNSLYNQAQGLKPTMPITPQEFVSKWKRVTAREKQTYQEHFIDLCRLVGHQTSNEYDPTGTRFGFEMGAAKTSGGPAPLFSGTLSTFVIY